jgi:predicted HTH domain antitoxin
MSVTITIPDSALEAAQMSASELKQEVALMLYQQSRLTLAQARRLAEMERAEFQQLLANRKIPIYDVPEFEKDLENLKAMGQL